MKISALTRRSFKCWHLRLLALLVATNVITGTASQAGDISAYPVTPLVSPDTARLKARSSKSAETSTTYKFSAMGRDFELQLQPSSLKINDPEARDSARLFQGQVVGDPDSWVRLSEIDGNLTGMFKAWGELYKLADSTTLPADSISTRTALLKVSDNPLPGEVTFRAPEAPVDTLLYPPPAANQLDTMQAPRLRAADQSTLRAVRIGVVIDSLYDEKNNGNGSARALGAINAVDGIYQDELGTTLVVERVTTLSADEDPLRDQLDGTMENYLNSFRNYRRRSVNLPADLSLVHLFSGFRDPADVIGLSWIGTVCRTDGYDVSLSTRFVLDDLLAAHEIGHNLGAAHDDNPACDTDNSFIMWPLLSNQTRGRFSECSKQAIRPGVESSCNLDVIDLAMTASNPTSDGNGLTTVDIQIDNLSEGTLAARQRVEVSLPPEVVLATPISACSRANDQLQCNLAEIGFNQPVALTIGLRNTLNHAVEVEATLTHFGAADPDTNNNTIKLQLAGSQSNDSSIILADSDSPARGSSAGGLVFLQELLALLTLLGWRLYRYWR